MTRPKSGFPALAALVACLVCLSIPARAEDEAADIEPVAATAGSITLAVSKYEGHERYRQVLAALPDMRQKAFAAIKNRLGIAYEDKGTIEVRFVDLNEEGFARHGGDHATRITEKSGGKERMVVLVFWEYVMNGSIDPQTVLTHELFHAIHREGSTETAYIKTPKWVREGIAVWVADQGPDRLRYILQDRIEQGPDSLVDGLENQPHTSNDYAEDYLAFEYIRERHGLPKLHGFAQDLVRTQEDYRSLLRKHTGQDWTAFEAGVRAFALEKIRKEENGVRDKFLPGLQLYQKGLYGPASEVLAVFARENPDAYCVGLAHYYHARCLFQQGKYPEARRGLLDVVAKYPGRIGLIDDAKAYLGISFFKESSWDNARRELEETIRDYPYSSHLPMVRFHLGASLGRMNRPQDAATVFEESLRLYPKSKAADDLWRALGDASLKAGRTDRAREAYRKLLALFPRSPHAKGAEERLRELDSRDEAAAQAGIAGVREAAERKDWTSVVALATQRLRHSPPDEEAAEAQALLGIGYHSLDMHEEAIAALQVALEKWPNSAQAVDARFRLGKSHFLLKRYEPAVEQFERLNTDHPRHTYPASANLYMGEALFHLGRHSRALDRLQASAAAKDKRYVFLACYWMGRAYQALGEPANAKRAFQRVVQESPNPEHPMVARARAELSK